MNKKMLENIRLLKEKHNSIILAHNYQPPEVQDIGDFVGDSFALSQKAQKSDKNIIILYSYNI